MNLNLFSLKKKQRVNLFQRQRANFFYQRQQKKLEGAYSLQIFFFFFVGKWQESFIYTIISFFLTKIKNSRLYFTLGIQQSQRSVKKHIFYTSGIRYECLHVEIKICILCFFKQFAIRISIVHYSLVIEFYGFVAAISNFF